MTERAYHVNSLHSVVFMVCQMKQSTLPYLRLVFQMNLWAQYLNVYSTEFCCVRSLIQDLFLYVCKSNVLSHVNCCDCMFGVWSSLVTKFRAGYHWNVISRPPYICLLYCSEVKQKLNRKLLNLLLATWYLTISKSWHCVLDCAFLQIYPFNIFQHVIFVNLFIYFIQRRQ
jgi:hypothetical protein